MATHSMRGRYVRSLLTIFAGSFAAASPALATDVWTDQSGDNLWNTTSINWLVNGVAGKYTEGDAVIFNDASGPGHYNITLAAGLNPASIIVNNSAGNYVFGGTGFIGSANSASLLKLGSSQLILNTTSANTYTGATTVREGTLVVDLGFLSTHTNLISPSSALTLGGGGLTILGAVAASAQTFNGTTIDSGASSIVNLGGSSTTALNLGAITRNIGGTVDFAVPAAGASNNTTNPNPNGILGGYATVGGTDWAVAGSPITPFSAYVTTWTIPNTNNTTVTGNLTPNPDGVTNSLRFNSGAGSFTVTLVDTSTNFNTIVSGGILMTANVGANNNTVTGGLLTSTNGKDLIAIQNDTQGALTIASQVINNQGTVIGFTKSGPGTAILSGPNTYTGVTTINGGVLSVSSLVVEGAVGGTASGIGQSGNGAGNLVLNRGTLQYTGAGGSTDRLFTLGPGGGGLDASGTGVFTFAGNGAGSANTIAFSQDTPAVFTLTGTSTAQNAFLPIIPDPDAAHTYSTSVVKSGPGTWVVSNANTYTGGTTVNGGALKVNNLSGSGTGLGPVIVNSGGSLGGLGSVAGPTTINSGGTIAPGDATNFTINNSLTLNTGARGSYAFDQPNILGPVGGNDLVTVTGGLTLNTNFGVTVTPGNNFSNGTYTLIHYGSITDNSTGFSGWSAGLLSAPVNLPAGQFYKMNFANDSVGKNVNLVVSTTPTTPTLGTGQTGGFVQPPNIALNNSNVNNPIVIIQGGPGGNQGAGGPGNINFFIARGPQPAAKAFTFGWIPLVFQLPPGTPYFVPNNVLVGDPAQTGIPTSPNPPFRTNPPFNSPFTGTVGTPPFGAIYPAGSIPIAAAPDDWLPAFFLAPLIVFRDPPATPVPTYYGEGFTNPNHDVGIYLAAQLDNGLYQLPSALDTLALGSNAKFNYQGSFLSEVQSVFPAITNLSQLTNDQWITLNGSFGVDAANSIAWSVNDTQAENYTVIAVGVPEPASLMALAIGGSALLMRRRRR